jgi:clathrin heavy chain
LSIIRQLAATNPDAAVNLAKQTGKNVDINEVAEIFLGLNNIEALTSYLLEVLNENLPEHGHL